MNTWRDFKIKWTEDKPPKIKPKCYADYLKEAGYDPKDVGDPKDLGEVHSAAKRMLYKPKTS